MKDELENAKASMAKLIRVGKTISLVFLLLSCAQLAVGFVMLAQGADDTSAQLSAIYTLVLAVYIETSVNGMEAKHSK